MNKTQKQLTAAVSALALVLATFGPAVAATNMVVSGNGSDTHNAIEVQSTSQTTVVQENDTDIDNKINVSADTGNNTASDNTGGDVRVETGDSTTAVMLENMANSNVAEVEACNGCGEDTNILVNGNGTESENYVGFDRTSATQLFQNNRADIDNDVDVDANTGGNQVDDNTGAEEAVVVTGDAEVSIVSHNQANSNSASVSAGDDDDDSGVNLWVTGNGSHSKNAIELRARSLTLLSQLNETDIDNEFDVEANTGDNTISDSVSGMVGIGTGDARVLAEVDNAAGFNYADIDGCCTDSVYAKIAENGTDSENYLGAQLDSALDVFQENTCGHHGPKGLFDLFSRDGRRGDPCFDNDLDLEAYTGANEADDNTGDADADPIVITGDTTVGAAVSNTGASNTFGAGSGDSGINAGQGGMNLDLDIDLDLNWSDLLAFLLGS